jgi:hypothetical protein
VPEQKVLDAEIWCPVSGFQTKNAGAIPPHKIGLIVCVDGNLYGRCPIHLAKIFIQDKETIRRITEGSNVVRVKEKRVKETKNAAS